MKECGTWEAILSELALQVYENCSIIDKKLKKRTPTPQRKATGIEIQAKSFQSLTNDMDKIKEVKAF